jgi:hypothetical protein
VKQIEKGRYPTCANLAHLLQPLRAGHLHYSFPVKATYKTGGRDCHDQPHHVSLPLLHGGLLMRFVSPVITSWEV